MPNWGSSKHVELIVKRQPQPPRMLGIGLNSNNQVTEPGHNSENGLLAWDKVVSVDGVALGSKKLSAFMDTLEQSDQHSFKVLRYSSPPPPPPAGTQQGTPASIVAQPQEIVQAAVNTATEAVGTAAGAVGAAATAVGTAAGAAGTASVSAATTAVAAALDIASAAGAAGAVLLGGVWRGVLERTAVFSRLPVIGLLVLDGDVRSFHGLGTNSYMYRIAFATIRGVNIDHARSGESLRPEQQQALSAAVEELVAAGAVAIIGAGAALLPYQGEASRYAQQRPCLLSPLLQAPLLGAVCAPSERVLVLTADAASGLSEEGLAAQLRQLGMGAAAIDRFALREIGDALPAADAPLAAEAQGRLLERVGREVEACGGGEAGGVKAILVEASLHPAYADAMRSRLGVAVFDQITLADFAYKACTDNPRFGVSFGSSKEAEAKLAAQHAAHESPAIGVLRIDYQYPPAPGDIAHPNSYGYRTPHATMRGLTFEAAQEGAPLTDEQRAAMAAAVAELQAQQGVQGLAGDCGFLIRYQQDAAALARVPCFISALLQCPFLGPAHPAAAPQPVETAVCVVAQLATPSSHGGKPRLGAAPHAPEGPLSHWACSRWRGCPLRGRARSPILLRRPTPRRRFSSCSPPTAPRSRPRWTRSSSGCTWPTRRREAASSSSQHGQNGHLWRGVARQDGLLS